LFDLAIYAGPEQGEKLMKKMVMGIAIAALCAGPAMAKDKRAMKEPGSKQSTSLSEEDQNRLQNKDGTLQGKPVVQGPADWSSVNADSASSGASSGDAGSAGSSKSHE
jgi:hypothetical protein